MCLRISAIAISFGLAETITWSVISVITVVGTIFGICKLVKDIRRLPDHNVYVLSLLASDFCIGVVGHTTLAFAAYSVTIPCIMARAVESVTFFSIIVSFSSSLVVAINRNRALDVRRSRALNRLQRNSSNVLNSPLFVVSLIWLFSMLFTLAVALTKLSFSKFRTLIGLLCFLIIGANCRLLYKLRRLNASIHANPDSNIIPNRGQQLAIRVINAVTITLLLTCLPIVVVSSLIRAGVFVGDVVFAFTYKFVLFGPAIDPITYVIIYHVLK